LSDNRSFYITTNVSNNRFKATMIFREIDIPSGFLSGSLTMIFVKLIKEFNFLVFSVSRKILVTPFFQVFNEHNCPRFLNSSVRDITIFNKCFMFKGIGSVSN